MGSAWRVRSAACGLFLLACACPIPVEVAQQDRSNGERELVVDGPYVHEASGVVFPTALASCVRGRIVAYTASADDVGVTYESTDWSRPFFATIYVYPKRGSGSQREPDVHFRAVLAEVSKYHDEAVVGEPEAVTVASHGDRGSGLRARCTYRTRMGVGNAPVVSDAWLFSCGEWWVKYRITCPEGRQSSIASDVDALLRGIRWPGDE